MVQFTSTLPDYSQPVHRQPRRRPPENRVPRVATLPNYAPTTVNQPPPMPAGHRVPEGWTTPNYQDVVPRSSLYHYSQQLHSLNGPLGSMSSLEQAGLTAVFLLIAVGGIMLLLSSKKSKF